MIVLGVETSCDETSVAIVKDGKQVLANVVFSQIAIHEEFGGVVPEVASRHHVGKLTFVFEQALQQAQLNASDIDLVAVTSEPGLIGSLLVGIISAEAFALANNIPIIYVNHLTGHIYANYLESDFYFPIIALVVSGGHTELVLMRDHYDFEILGKTMDDAVGEAYDKVGRVMGLPYPGGKYVDQLALQGTFRYQLPLVYLDKDSYNFSFSGLKSAVINLINQSKIKNEELNLADLAASFQTVATTVLVDKTIQAAQEYNAKHIIVAGGVAANRGLRNLMKEKVSQLPGVVLTFPSFEYCTDNAAMIAVSGYFKYLKNQTRNL